MAPAQMVQIALGLSLILIVLSLGMRCSWSEATYLLRHPALLLRSVLAMNVLMPLAAVLLVMVWPLDKVVQVALLAMAISPVPPILPSKELTLVIKEDYVWSLFILSAMLAVIFVPLLVTVIGAVFHREDEFPIQLVAKPILLSVLTPLFIGMLIRQYWHDVAVRIRGPLAKIGNVLLVLASLVVLVAMWPQFRHLLGDGTLLAFAVLTAIGLAIGHLLGGPDDENRSVLALVTGTHHPGIAIAIGAAGFPGDKLIPAAVLLALLVSLVVSMPYTSWRRKRHMKATAAASTGGS